MTSSRDRSACRIGRIAGLLLVIAFSGCATLRTDYPKPVSQALAPAADTPSLHYLHSEVEAHPGRSGFRLLVANMNALMSRIVLADHAAHSIDLQYYLFKNDPTGRLLAQHLLAAADRGVRVRILLDDLGIDKEDHLLDALDAHANIEVRLFNPFSVRNRSLWAKAGQFLVEGRRLNRRMHNKSFIVDNAIAVVGGRNIGDAYFDAGEETHFNDLDVIAIGPIVPQTSAMFDAYWNSEAAFPVKAFKGARATAADLARAREHLTDDARRFAESDYAQAVDDELPSGPSADRRGRWFWGEATLVADDPGKVDPDRSARVSHMAPQVKTLLDAARTQATIVSPYFVPGRTGAAYLGGLAARGVGVRVLTNSLAATDEPEVHSGYVRYRRGLLEAGVELYELRPIAGKEGQHAYGTSSGVSLHAKAMVVDHRYVFVGSMNFDPRSRLLNTEMGVIADSPELAGAVDSYFKQAAAPQNAFHVTLEPGRTGTRALRWTAADGDKTVTFDHEPGASWWQRARLQMLRVLPIEGLL
jgi:putative cardiolipin synthase